MSNPLSNAPLPSRSPRRTVSPRSARLLLAPLLALLPTLPLACLARPTQAADAPLPPPPPAPTAGLEDSLMQGARYFDQAIAFVARGGTLGRAVDLYAHLDVKWDLEDNHHEGEQKVWFQTPDRMRTEIVAAGKAQTKILLGDKAWNILPNGTVRRVHGTPDAAPQMKQMAEDLVRVQDLTAFVTLEGLKGPGITFQFQGATKGDGLYAGNWLKVARRAPDGRKITFWLGMETAPDGSVRATAPGVVRIDGDPATGLWTEDWIFSDWDAPRAQPRPYRYPARLQAWRIHPDPAKVRESPPSRFLFAAVNDIQINAGIPPQVFTPPAETPGR